MAEDLVDAYTYVSKSGPGSLAHDLHKPGIIDPSRIVIAGMSGGGYCAVVTALEILKKIPTSPELRKPAALAMIYPMLDFLSDYWVGGSDLSDDQDLHPSEEDFQAGRKDFERIMREKEVSFGEGFPPPGVDIVHHGRWNLLRYVLKVPLLIDTLTGSSGLGKKLSSVESISTSTGAAKREQLVPSEARRLFVLDFDNLTSELPPVFVVHGLGDTAVPHEDSDKFTQKTKALGVPTRYWPLEGFNHDFDMEYSDLEETNESDIGAKALGELLLALEGVVGS